MSAAPISDTVIAKFAPGPMSVSFAVTLAIFGVCWFTILQHPAGTEALEYTWATDKAMVLVTFIYTPLAAWRLGSVIRQMICRGGRAIWIEQHCLKYLAYGLSTYSSLALDDVQDVSIIPGGFLRPQRVAIRAKDRVDYVTPLFLTASAETIRARLAEAVALPKAS